MKMRGTVVRQTFGRGSKSEHQAVMLETSQGTYRLRRPDGNPFRDPILDDLVGHEIVAEGALEESVFMLAHFTVAR